MFTYLKFLIKLLSLIINKERIQFTEKFNDFSVNTEESYNSVLFHPMSNKKDQKDYNQYNFFKLHKKKNQKVKINKYYLFFLHQYSRKKKATKLISEKLFLKKPPTAMDMTIGNTLCLTKKLSSDAF
jgi:hypothetical protein